MVGVDQRYLTFLGQGPQCIILVRSRAEYKITDKKI